MRRTTLIASITFAAAATLAGAQAPAKIAGARGDFLGNFGQVEKKFIQLAEVFPVDKYSYTPGKGVRSVCEVLVTEPIFTSPTGAAAVALMVALIKTLFPGSKLGVE